MQFPQNPENASINFHYAFKPILWYSHSTYNYGSVCVCVQESGAVTKAHRSALLVRANELINVLKIPSIASAILSPSYQRQRQRQLQPALQKQTYLLHLLQAASVHLHH